MGYLDSPWLVSYEVKRRRAWVPFTLLPCLCTKVIQARKSWVIGLRMCVCLANAAAYTIWVMISGYDRRCGGCHPPLSTITEVGLGVDDGYLSSVGGE